MCVDSLSLIYNFVSAAMFFFQFSMAEGLLLWATDTHVLQVDPPCPKRSSEFITCVQEGPPSSSPLSKISKKARRPVHPPKIKGDLTLNFLSFFLFNVVYGMVNKIKKK